MPDSSSDGLGFPRPSVSEWIALALGSFLVVQYAWLLDDAFVYFRYVDNALFLERGLVFNAGEYVEGYSSPLWALLLLPLRATGMNYWILVRLVGVLCFVGFWALAVLANRDLTVDREAPVLNLPLVFMAANYGVASYFTSGLESPLVLLSAALYGLYFLRPTSRWIQVLLGLTPLVRHELLIPVAVAWVCHLVRERRVPVLMTVSTVGSVGAWLVFRILYYAELFPNTFYLKNEVDWAQGLRYLHDTAWPYGLYAIVPLVVGVALRLKRTGRLAAAGPRLWMLACALPVLVFVAKIGGDPRHFRYLAFPFVLLCLAGGGIAEAYLARVPSSGARAIAVAVAVAILGVGLFTTPRQVGGLPVTRSDAHRIVSRISDASLHRHHPTLAHDPWGSGQEIEQRERYAELRRGGGGARHTELMVGFWCVTQYEKFDSRVVHSLGLTDAVLARVRMPADRPAHKLGLKPLAIDVARVYAFAGDAPGRGMYSAAIEAGIAAPWIAQNRTGIEGVEAKIFNRHAFAENLRLAFTFPGRFQP